MQQYLSLIFLSMPINALVIVPILFLKIDKREKIGLAIRLYIISIFLIASLVTVASNCDSNFPSLPVWTMLLSVILFMIALTSYVKYSRKFLKKFQRRALVLASFLILFATRASVSDFHYGMSTFNMVWYGTFIFAFLLAYIGTSDVTKLDSLSAGLMSASSQGRIDKSYAPQSEIDYDVHTKGKGALNDPDASIIERQRYNDAINKKEDRED